MCDRDKFLALSEKVDNVDHRLTVVETSLTDVRKDIEEGFNSLRGDLGRIYEEKAAWGRWAREHLGTALKWAGAIILSACGITQLSSLVKLVMGVQ